MAQLYDRLIAWDRAGFQAINTGLKNPLLDRVMPTVSDIGLTQVQIIVILAAAAYLGFRAREVLPRRPWRGMWAVLRSRRGWLAPLMIAITIAGVSSTWIKSDIPRHRPWWYYEHEHRVGRRLADTVKTVPGRDPLKVRSFPSGHSATSVAIAGVVSALFWRRRRLVAAVWFYALAVGVSRIYIADHWPLDVVGGAALGIASAVISLVACRAWARGSQEQRDDGRADDCVPKESMVQSGKQV